MLREGPIPAFLHGLWEYLLGLALIVAPLLLNFHSDGATAAAVVIGVLIIALAAMSAGSTSLVNQVPLAAHVVLDYLLVVILIAAPFVLNFTSQTEPTAIFIGAGVLQLLISIGTRFRPSDKPPERGRRRARASTAATLPTEGGTRGGAAADEAPRATERRAHGDGRR